MAGGRDLYNRQRDDLCMGCKPRDTDIPLAVAILCDSYLTAGEAAGVGGEICRASRNVQWVIHAR
jgi:hypothetical protein